MPLCLLYTNLKDTEVPGDLEVTLAETIAKALGKPMQKMNVTIQSGLRMYRLESTAPTCFLQIHSIDVFDKERNPTYTQPIIDVLKNALNIDGNRIVIQYLPIHLHDVGLEKPS
ncbi:D-dopachrome decarboxylase-B-like [Haliotis rufescens]|uniref:D-dopachrome decarboxylase-B-like n=1 Tax=Haliotis rufescens TaxID=6454 RepID=UPI00201F49DD|nr:D-dopachrome decarboxylase-B-like [Haliotis rufescens]